MNRLRHALQCSEIWGGNQEIDADVWTRSLHASVYSRSVEGGKGGDIYYFSLCANDRLTRLALADVTGHGKVVSDISQWIYEALSHQMNTRESSAVLQELNRRVKPSESTSEYNSVTTATVVTVNRMDSTIRFAYAGHPPMLVKRQGKKEWTEVGLKSPSHGGNIPLGVLEQAPFDEETLALESGDWLFLYTDGVTEAWNQNNELLGKEGLLEVLNHAPLTSTQVLKQTVLQALSRHLGSEPSHDDLTLITMKLQ